MLVETEKYVVRGAMPSVPMKVRQQGIEGSVKGMAGLSRTFMHSASHFSKEKVITENFSDVVGGWQYIATLDRRTCLGCAGDDGKEFAMDEDKPVLARHWDCRYVYVPVLKKWSDLAGPKSKISKQRLRELEKMDVGPRPAVKDITDVSQFKGSYNEWLQAQLETDPEFVKRVLGPGRFELFKKGKISLSAMSTHGRIKRLSELSGVM